MITTNINVILFWVLLSIKIDIQNNETQNLSTVDYGCMFIVCHGCMSLYDD